LLVHTYDILGQVWLIAFFAIMAATPLAILTLGIVNFVRAVTRRGTIVLQTVAAIAAWTVLTGVLFMVFMMVVFEFPYPMSRADELKSTAVFLIGCLIYAAVGGLLVYWTKHQAKLSATVGR
jgi:hypothetical protein